ncbi:MAG TPA: VanZ family protein [Candidatus Acidoferrum sp.]|nr:VanZ family protein [Candidatus Acidoferrum sp.]
MPRLNRKVAGLISAIIAVSLLLVGLWPFAFRPLNNAGWLKQRTGLAFRVAGVAYDPEPLDWSVRTQPDQPGAFTVELWLEPVPVPATDAFYLLTIDDGQVPAGAALCQWETELLLRVRDPANARGFREVGPEDALAGEDLRVLAVTASPSGTSFYTNGLLADRFPGFTVPRSHLGGRLVLGNAITGKHPWTGNLLGLAIFNRALDAPEIARHHDWWARAEAKRLASEAGLTALYLFDESAGLVAHDYSPHQHRLLVPERYTVLRKRVLEPPWGPSAIKLSDLDDIVVNILGFIPFGFMVFWHRWLVKPGSRIGNLVWTVSAGATVSLAIELIQVWLPNRTSSLLDLLTNTLGTFLGVLIARRILPKGTRAADHQPNFPH